MKGGDLAAAVAEEVIHIRCIDQLIVKMFGSLFTSTRMIHDSNSYESDTCTDQLKILRLLPSIQRLAAYTLPSSSIFV